jgi:hypothetical protein
MVKLFKNRILSADMKQTLDKLAQSQVAPTTMGGPAGEAAPSAQGRTGAAPAEPAEGEPATESPGTETAEGVDSEVRRAA